MGTAKEDQFPGFKAITVCIAALNDDAVMTPALSIVAFDFAAVLVAINCTLTLRREAEEVTEQPGGKALVVVSYNPIH